MRAMKARMLVPAVLVIAALGGCGSGDTARARPQADARPGDGKPAVRLATKNFTEQYVLGELYAQALRARGFTVDLKEDVGSSEIVDRAMTTGGIDMYPEYTGVIVHELAKQRDQPASVEETYQRAKMFEEKRGFTLLEMTPGFDADANAVRPALARRHNLRTTADLKRLGRFRYGGPAENRTRFAGAIGLRKVYGLTGLQYVSLKIPERYEALDSGRVDVIAVFTTEGQLADRERYTVLSDPKGVFGFQNIAPVINRRVLRQQGPAFERAVNAVSAKLTNEALQDMNAAVDLRHETPRDVAADFLQEHDLV
jgi:osmoprotectant transport system substrate-binding protein